MKIIAVIFLLFTSILVQSQSVFYLKNKDVQFLNVNVNDSRIQPELYTNSDKIQKIQFEGRFAEVKIIGIDGTYQSNIAFPNDTIYVTEKSIGTAKNSFEDGYDFYQFTKFIGIHNYTCAKRFPEYSIIKLTKNAAETYKMSIDSLDFYHKNGKISNSFHQFKSHSYYYNFLSVLLEEKDEKTFQLYTKNNQVLVDSMLCYSEYRNFVRNYFEHKIMTKNATLQEKIRQIDQNFEGKIKKTILSFYLISDKESQKLPKTFVASLSSEAQSVVNENITTVIEIKTNPKQTTLLTNSQIQYNLKEVLSQHKGKVIYIDFWASWCIPCKESLPESLALAEEFSKEKFTIIYLSIDEDFDRWKRAEVANSIQNSNSYFLANSSVDTFVKQLKIKTIPRYILYDSEGNLVDEDADSPESETLKNHLKELLKK